MKYFGTDGIRDYSNKLLNNNFIYKLGKSIKKLGCNEVIIGVDTRESSINLLNELLSGIDITYHYVGVISTPGLIYLSLINKMVGIMITASHNPYYYNGIKIIKNGIKLSNDEEKVIEDNIDNIEIINKEYKLISINYNYIDSYYLFLNKYISKNNLKIALDCANGALSNIADKIYKMITPNLIIINNKPNGYNINDKCGSTHINSLKDVVINNKCDIGFAFDGDGDRLIAILADGSIIDGDKLLFILALYLKKINKLKNNTIVLSIMSNIGIIKELNKLGINVIESPVGDKNIYQALLDNDLSLGYKAGILG